MRHALHGLVAVWLMLLVGGTTAARADFELQDGDVVVFLGDSNTAAGGYFQVLEIYSLLRFPTRDVTFINSGVGSDTAVGGAARLETTVFNHNPTTLFVTYGINDILACLVMEEGPDKTACFDTAQTNFINAMVDIVTRSQARGIRVYACSYPVLGLGQEVNDRLQTLGDIARYIAIVSGEHGVDVHRNMRAIVGATPPASYYANPDFIPGVHLNDRGHNLWAYALAQGLGAPAEVSSVTVNAATLTGSATGGATVSNISGSTSLVQFTRLDPGLPISFGSPVAWYSLAAIPWHNLSSYRLQVTNLQAGTYEIRAAGRLLKTLTHTQLAAGQHIANLQPADGWTEGGPWVVQGTAVRQMVSGRASIASGRQWIGQLAATNPNDGYIQMLNDDAQATLREMLRTAAQPYPYAFEVKRIGP